MILTLKNIVSRVLLILRRLASFFVAFEEISVLAYHSVSESGVDTAISRKDLVRHLEHLKARGATFESLRHIVLWHRGKRALPRKVVSLTFDDGYVDFETDALPVLEKFQAPATLFVLGDRTLARSRLGNDIPLLDDAALVRLNAHPLVSIGYHSREHQDVSKLSREQLTRECRSPFPAEFFAYPGGVHSLEARDALKELGYDAAFSLKPELVKRSSDAFVMPRNIVLKDMSLWQLDFRTTKAIDWYRALWRFFKYGLRV